MFQKEESSFDKFQLAIILFNHIVSKANDEFVCSACSEFGMFVPKKLKY